MIASEVTLGTTVIHRGYLITLGYDGMFRVHKNGFTICIRKSLIEARMSIDLLLDGE